MLDLLLGSQEKPGRASGRRWSSSDGPDRIVPEFLWVCAFTRAPSWQCKQPLKNMQADLPAARILLDPTFFLELRLHRSPLNAEHADGKDERFSFL